MAALTVATIVDSGLTRSHTAVSSSDTFVDDGTGRTFIEIANGGGGSINATFTAQQTSQVVPGVGNVTIADIVVAVGAGVTKLIGPFTRAYISTAGSVTVSYSGTTTVTATAYKLAKED